jgi:hypothetical protein
MHRIKPSSGGRSTPARDALPGRRPALETPGVSATLSGQKALSTVRTGKATGLQHAPRQADVADRIGPLLEALGLAELTHDPKNNRMRAR